MQLQTNPKPSLPLVTDHVTLTARRGNYDAQYRVCAHLKAVAYSPYWREFHSPVLRKIALKLHDEKADNNRRHGLPCGTMLRLFLCAPEEATHVAISRTSPFIVPIGDVEFSGSANLPVSDIDVARKEALAEAAAEQDWVCEIWE